MPNTFNINPYQQKNWYDSQLTNYSINGPQLYGNSDTVNSIEATTAKYNLQKSAQTGSNYDVGFINSLNSGGGGGNSQGLTAGQVSPWAQAASAVGSTLQQFGKQPKDDTVKKLNAASDQMANAALQSGNPYAMMAGAAVKVGSAINRMTGNGGVDGMTGFDKFASSDFGFMLGAMNPDPIAQTLYWVNRATAKTTDKFIKDAELEAAQGDAYADTYGDLDAAQAHAGKTYGGLSRKYYNKWQQKIAAAKRMENTISNINAENIDAQAAAGYTGVGLANQAQLNGGMQMLRAGKNGLKLNNIDFAKKVKQWLVIPDLDVSFLNENVQEFEEGGVLEAPQETIVPFDLDSLVNPQFLKEGGAFNVIPDGALHKNKHHMEDAEGLTKKGIPVVTEEDGKLTQQAEIEVNEIILHLELTEKLEKLAKEGTEEAAIEAGKLLVKELLHNTVDNTGLLKEVE